MRKVVILLLVAFSLIAGVNAAQICEYASSASATSVELGSEAIYATGAPDADRECIVWSGVGKSWSPANWNIKANITLTYNQSVYAGNLTIFGDDDMCWSRMWLKNSATGQVKEIFNGDTYDCEFNKILGEDFLADKVVLQTCGWAWSSTDAVRLCGSTITLPVCGNGIVEETEKCEVNTNCSITECDNLDGCVGKDYYDYNDMTNNCLSNCSCETKTCTGFIKYANDSRCVIPPVCGDGIIEATEECDDGNKINGDGCSGICKNEIKPEPTEVYFVPYIGDIDGSVDSEWFYFYDKLVKWHDDNNIPIGISFYPNTMNDNTFNNIIGDAYNSEDIELVLKGESDGTPLDEMSYEEVKATIGASQNKFISELKNLGYSEVKPFVTYNQLYGRFTETIRNAVHDLGFKIYLEQYVSKYGYIDSLPDFDITQYSVSVTESGMPGANEKFKQPDTIIQEIINFEHPELIYINGTKVVPLLVHQQDFRLNEASSELNTEKWSIYTTLLLMAKNDSRIKMILPEEVYNLRHPSNSTPPPIPTNYSIEICDWQDCHAGAASVSMDDSYPSCREILNNNGFKGTYYLSRTVYFTKSKWALWNEMHKEGHEIGGHTQNHLCQNLIDSRMKTEIESNRRDILTHINMSAEDFSSFAWPCGQNNANMQAVASKYFVSARGYFINKLEEKNPSNFMELKSLNTPHYHDPANEPPNYFLMADEAEKTGKWVNYVFHNTCPDDGAINYLTTKDLWVAPVGIVAKYIKERKDVRIESLNASNSEINFNLKSSLNSSLFNQEVTLKLIVEPSKVSSVRLNEKNIPFTWDVGFIRFNVHPTGNDNVKVIISNLPSVCGNGIVEGIEECDDGNNINLDGCSSICKKEATPTDDPIRICQYASSASATSVELGSEAIYATGAPNADRECIVWSGVGKSWSPANWNIKANITLTYNQSVYAGNLTIFGDDDMCWSRMWLKNSATGQVKEIFNGNTYDCEFNKILGEDFLADRIILQTCGWAWSSTDAVRLCGRE